MFDWIKKWFKAEEAEIDRGRFRAETKSKIDPLNLKSHLDLQSKTFSEWFNGVPTLYATLNVEQLNRLNQYFSKEVGTLTSDADDILKHQFDLLGSGKFNPINTCKAGSEGYTPIDWCIDPIRNLQFPNDVHYKKWELYSMRPENADVKYPWELGRCQHWVTLAQAYLVTEEKKYAAEIRDQLYDFMEENPIGFGVNWTCTMDVAIRALNWALSINMIHKANLGNEFYEDAYDYLFLHGKFIFDNLENNYEVTSNHFLSNVVGLYYLSFLFSDFEECQRWNLFCRESLEKEIVVQVLDDGADYESSVPYHRLVTELFLGAARLSRFFNEPLSEGYHQKLNKMLVFLEGILRPDGFMPQVGDADDGRLHIFSEYGSWKPQDARHLFGPGGQFFHNSIWKNLSGRQGQWESAWWGFDLENAEYSAVDKHPETNFALYPQAGLAVARERGSYLLVTNGIVGTGGFGNHKHNDQLSFEYFHDGLALIVDPGSYVYTSDFDARNRFRSVRAHNTLCINGVEQNEMREEWIFRLFESAYAEHIHFKVGTEIIEYSGCHKGYDRLPEKVIHQRDFKFHRSSGALSFSDELKGSGQCTLDWHFCFAPDVALTLAGKNCIVLKTKSKSFEFKIPAGLDVVIGKGEYSPSYGIKQDCAVLDLSLVTELVGSMKWDFHITSSEKNTSTNNASPRSSIA